MLVVTLSNCGCLVICVFDYCYCWFDFVVSEELSFYLMLVIFEYLSKCDYL
ncbi:hypothetical protein DsansV1_C33g0224221 [Dioscorea sansibarensis]